MEQEVNTTKVYEIRGERILILHELLLDQAIRIKNYDLVKLLLKNRADVNEPDRRFYYGNVSISEACHNTPLEVALKNQELGIVQPLIDRGQN